MGNYNSKDNKISYIIKENGDIYDGEYNKYRGKHGDAVVKYKCEQGLYEGQVWYDKKDGKGKMTYKKHWTTKNWDDENYKLKQGAVYEGNWQDDLEHGSGKITYPKATGNDVIILEGQWEDGKISGCVSELHYTDGSVKKVYQGKLIYKDGTYEGEWYYDSYQICRKNGKKIYTNGDVYEGEWKRNYKEGKGKMIYANGDIYEGEWDYDHHSEQGEMIYENGDIFEGRWYKTPRDGIMKYANGDVYKGGFLENTESCGLGEMIYRNGDVYKGFWLNGKKNGQGKMIYSNGSIYEGHWKDDMKHGTGEFILKRGCGFLGHWKNDKKISGIEYTTNGIIRKGRSIYKRIKRKRDITHVYNTRLSKKQK
jgi:hypothetical protein